MEEENRRKSLRPRADSSSSANGIELPIDLLTSAIRKSHLEAKEHIVVRCPADGAVKILDFSNGKKTSNRFRLIEKFFSQGDYEADGLSDENEIDVYFPKTGKSDAGYYTVKVEGVFKDSNEALDRFKAFLIPNVIKAKPSNKSVLDRVLSKKAKSPYKKQKDSLIEIPPSGSSSVSSSESPMESNTAENALDIRLEDTSNLSLEPRDPGISIHNDSFGSVGHPNDSSTLGGSQEHTQVQNQEQNTSRSGTDRNVAYESFVPFFSGPDIPSLPTPLNDANVNAMDTGPQPPSPLSYDITQSSTASEYSRYSDNFYWRKIHFDRWPQQALRPGYPIFIYQAILSDLNYMYGPGRQDGWRKYAWNLVVHMLGDIEGVRKLANANGVGVEAALSKSTIIAIVGHVKDLFQLTVPINEKAFLQTLNNNVNSVKKKADVGRGRKRKS